MILACLTDDVAWEMPPYFKLSGRTAFDDRSRTMLLPVSQIFS
jgi:hypothetical protein